MSNPYSQPSISGYNSSPPADDGTQVASNQLTWAKHKTKLADPIKTYAAAIDAAALAAHGLAFGAAILAKTGAYTVTSADRGRLITVTGTTTITLPAAATAGEGFPLLIVNIGTGVVTIDGATSETINGNTSVDVQSGDSFLLTCNGTSWSGADIGGNSGSVKQVDDSTTTPLSAVALTDKNTIYNCTNAGAITATIPANASVAFPIGTVFGFTQMGAGQVTVAVTSDTLDSPDSLVATRAQYSTIFARKTAATVWVLSGDLGA